MSGDGKSKVKPVRSSDTVEGAGKHTPIEGTKRASPVLIVGFPGSGLVGSICANYIIEKKNLHQIAYVDSEFVVPSALYIGGRLRHPFRIYSDSSRTLHVIICEAPIMPDGVHSIINLLVLWASENGISEVIVLDGVPIRGLPAKQRKPLILSSHQSSSVPTDSSLSSAIMIGLSGGFISACLSDGMPCSAFLVQSPSGIPDPEGAAILLETVDRMPSVPLNIDVGPLKKRGQEIRRELKDFTDSLRRGQRSDEGSRYLKRSGIYG